MTNTYTAVFLIACAVCNLEAFTKQETAVGCSRSSHSCWVHRDENAPSRPPPAPSWGSVSAKKDRHATNPGERLTVPEKEASTRWARNWIQRKGLNSSKKKGTPRGRDRRGSQHLEAQNSLCRVKKTDSEELPRVDQKLD